MPLGNSGAVSSLESSQRLRVFFLAVSVSLVAGISAGISVAGISVAGISVAGISVAGISVASDALLDSAGSFSSGSFTISSLGESLPPKPKGTKRVRPK